MVRSRLFSAALTLVVAVGTGIWAVVRFAESAWPAWALCVTLLALLSWLIRSGTELFEHGGVAAAAAMLAVLCGALAAPATDGVALIPAVAGAIALVADGRAPLGAALGVIVGAVVLLVSAAAVAGLPLLAALVMIGGMLLGGLSGYSRRLRRQAQSREAELIRKEARLHEERARVAIARDLHDVLAHSLGGLVIQLDAAEALLDAGRAGEARTRVASARHLAADGLIEAREAVAALRDPDAAISSDGEKDLQRGVDDLLAAHRVLGGVVELQSGDAGPACDEETASTLLHVLREALSNARRHAPGVPVQVVLGRDGDDVRMTVSNPMPATGPISPGGGFGLTGMRERLGELPGGDLRHAVVDGRFVLVATAPRRPLSTGGRP